MFRLLLSAILVVSCAFGFDSKIHGFATEDELSIEHLKEHYQDKIEIEKHTSASDRKFYYFKIGDTNRDSYLDGVEMLKMITEHSDGEKLNVEDLEVQVDQILSDIDNNGDGVISFSEYSKKFS